LWGTLLVVGVLGYFNENPIELESEDATSIGIARRGAAASDIMVVLWPDEIARSADTNRFADVDWSWAWVDLLESEVGAVRLCDPEELSQELLSEVRYLVITYSAMAHPAVAEATHFVEQFVNNGGVVVLSAPTAPLRDAFSADGRGGLRTPRSVTHAAEVDEAVATALTEMPLFTRYVGSTGPLAEAETLLAMDGAPVIYRVRRAAGTAVTVDFNLGMALVSLQQGRPDGEGFDLEPEHPSLGPTVSDLTADPALAAAEIPYLDVLAFVVVQAMQGRETPLPSLWLFPEGADGVVLLSHDITDDGDRSLWLAQYESAHGASSTFFFGYSAMPGRDSVVQYQQLGADLGVLWDRRDSESAGNRRTIGVGGLRPFYREASLMEQRDALQAAFEPSQLPIGVRSASGLWSSQYAEAFRAMSAANFVYDSSYGVAATQLNGLGVFRHATGRPFAVLDHNGLPLGLYEVPLIADGLATAEQMERLEALLTQSQRDTHQAIGVHMAGDLLQDEAGTVPIRRLADAAGAGAAQGSRCHELGPLPAISGGTPADLAQLGRSSTARRWHTVARLRAAHHRRRPRRRNVGAAAPAVGRNTAARSAPRRDQQWGRKRRRSGGALGARIGQGNAVVFAGIGRQPLGCDLPMNRPALSPIRGAVRPGVSRALRFELFVLLLVALVALGFYLDGHPIELGADEPDMLDGGLPEGTSSGDVLLVLAGQLPSQAPASFEEIDFSAAWTNILDQEFGAYRIVSLSEFSPNSLENTTLVVVPRLVGIQMTTGHVSTLAHFVETGGRLLVEMPGTQWSGLTGVATDPANFHPTRRITAFDGAVVGGDLRDDLLQAPLRSVLATVSLETIEALGDTDVVLEVDGQPGLLRRPYGRGEVHVLLFDLAQAVTAIQQGVPTVDWEVARPSLPLPAGLTRSAALVGEQRLRQNPIPWRTCSSANSCRW
jgi:hypothetical protein